MSESGTCHGFEEDLSALLDDELRPERAAELRDHVAVCASCRERLARLARVDSALSGAPAPAVPASLRARIEARLASDRSAGKEAARAPQADASRGAWRAVGAMAALAAGVAIYFAVAPGPSPPPVDLQSLPDDELGLALEIETVEDLDVIGNLELLELVLASEAG